MNLHLKLKVVQNFCFGHLKKLSMESCKLPMLNFFLQLSLAVMTDLNSVVQILKDEDIQM